MLKGDARDGSRSATAVTDHVRLPVRDRLFVLVAVVLVGVAALVLTGCAGPDETGTTSQRVNAWVEGSALGSDVATLIADGSRVGAVLSAHSGGTGAVHTDCAVLTTDAEAANTDLPAPDPTLTTELSDAYTLEYNAGDNCYAAGTTNRSLLDKSATQRARAKALLLQALARVDLLTGHPVSTTTTTNPDAGGIFG